MEAEREGLEVRGGILEIMNEGVGFLRTNYQVGQEDVYVSQAQLRRYELRSGDLVLGHVRPPRESERHYGLLKVETINGLQVLCEWRGRSASDSGFVAIAIL